ncbi:MAG: hypothetical protein FWF15_05165 [Oscillospiraceae bacterium]|nr:hypothetical protein [Oscillospiraceae bacterium]
MKKGDIIDIAAMKRGNNQMPIPMDNEKFLKIKTAFEKRGGIIQCDKATDKYLDSKMAEGLTYNENTILLKTNASVSAVFEELIHSAQYRQGRNDGTPENRLLMEIEAQKKLIKNQKAYGISDIENEQTKKALTDYYKELENLRKD